MKFVCSFSVGLAHDRHRPGDVTLSDKNVFNSVVKSGPGAVSANSLLCNVKCYWTDDQLFRVFNILSSETGMKPVANGHFVLANRSDYYNVQVERIPDAQDLNDASWLYLIAPKLSLAKFKSVEPDDSYVVTKVTSKKKIAFGCTDHVGWMMLFSEGLKDKFLDSGLRGLDFKQVKLGNGDPAGVWQITSHMRMPPLAMNLTDGQGGLFIGDETKACVVDEGSYSPMVLKYLQKDMIGAPEVDVIMSSERLGGAHNAHRMHIVSQRFRQVAEILAPGQFSYGLVAVGEGEELQTRYTIPELAPPR